MLAAARRLRLVLWGLRLRARLRRQGVALRLHAGDNLRVAGPPRLDLDLPAGARGGRLTLRIGRDVRIGRDLVLDLRPGGEHVIEVGDGSVLQDHVRLQLRGGSIRLADHVQLRDFCELKSAGELTLGSRVVCGRSASLHCVERVALGPRVGIGGCVTITDSDHAADGSDTWFLDQPLHVAPVVLEDNAWVGSNAVVLRGSRLGRNAVVAAGAVLVGLGVEPGWLAGGVPARPLRSLRIDASAAAGTEASAP